MYAKLNYNNWLAWVASYEKGSYSDYFIVYTKSCLYIWPNTFPKRPCGGFNSSRCSSCLQYSMSPAYNHEEPTATKKLKKRKSHNESSPVGPLILTIILNLNLNLILAHEWNFCSYPSNMRKYGEKKNLNNPNCLAIRRCPHLGHTYGLTCVLLEIQRWPDTAKWL